MNLEEKVHLQRLQLFRRAEELGNVSRACREAGVARSLYYPLRDRFRKYGADGLHPKHRPGRPGRPPALDARSLTDLSPGRLLEAALSKNSTAAASTRPRFSRS